MTNPLAKSPRKAGRGGTAALLALALILVLLTPALAPQTVHAAEGEHLILEGYGGGGGGLTNYANDSFTFMSGNGGAGGAGSIPGAAGGGVRYVTQYIATGGGGGGGAGEPDPAGPAGKTITTAGQGYDNSNLPAADGGQPGAGGTNATAGGDGQLPADSVNNLFPGGNNGGNGADANPYGITRDDTAFASLTVTGGGGGNGGGAGLSFDSGGNGNISGGGDGGAGGMGGPALVSLTAFVTTVSGDINITGGAAGAPTNVQDRRPGANGGAGGNAWVTAQSLIAKGNITITTGQPSGGIVGGAATLNAGALIIPANTHVTVTLKDNSVAGHPTASTLFAANLIVEENASLTVNGTSISRLVVSGGVSIHPSATVSGSVTLPSGAPLVSGMQSHTEAHTLTQGYTAQEATWDMYATTGGSLATIAVSGAPGAAATTAYDETGAPLLRVSVPTGLDPGEYTITATISSAEGVATLTLDFTVEATGLIVGLQPGAATTLQYSWDHTTWHTYTGIVPIPAGATEVWVRMTPQDADKQLPNVAYLSAAAAPGMQMDQGVPIEGYGWEHHITMDGGGPLPEVVSLLSYSIDIQAVYPLQGVPQTYTGGDIDLLPLVRQVNGLPATAQFGSLFINTLLTDNLLQYGSMLDVEYDAAGEVTRMTLRGQALAGLSPGTHTLRLLMWDFANDAFTYYFLEASITIPAPANASQDTATPSPQTGDTTTPTALITALAAAAALLALCAHRRRKA